MFNTRWILSITLLMFSSQALETHIRAGLDINVLKIDLNALSTVEMSTPFPLPQITAETRTTIDSRLDFGISGTYIPIILDHHRYHALKMSMHSYLKSRQLNSIGLGIHIHHIPLNPIDPSIIGYLNNVSLGLSMQGTLTPNIYTHFEICQDVTPHGYQSWETYMSENNRLFTLAPALFNFKRFSSAISIGYVFTKEL